MLLVMLTAIVVGMVGEFALAAWNPEAAHFKVKALPLWGVLVGGAALGVGMTLFGYCPGTVLVGVASGVARRSS